MWIVGWCIVCTGFRLLLLICHIISSFSFLSSYQTLKIFITFFSGTVRSRRLKVGTHVDSGQMYRVYRNQAAAYLSLCFFIFLFQTLKFFITLFSWTVRPRRLKLGTHVDSGQMCRIYRNQAAAAYLSPYFFIFFLSKFHTLNFFAHLHQELWGLEGWNLVVWCIPESGGCCLFVPLFFLSPRFKY